MGYGDDVRRLESKFSGKNRYPNFGPAIHSMEINGFRGVKELRLEFESPITALCGLNGTGKSTLAQIAACGYRKPTTGALRRYYVKDFFPVSAADPMPFTANAKIVYSYSVQSGGD